MWKIVFAFLLGMHGLIHLGYISPAPSDPNYPFTLNKSWLITDLGVAVPTVRAIGIALVVITVLGFLMAGLAAVQFFVPMSWGLPLTIVGAVASLLLLVMFWHAWLILGIVIDVALIVGLLLFHWQPFSVAGA